MPTTWWANSARERTMSTAGEKPERTMRVEVAHATPDRQVVLDVVVPEGCTLEDAIDRSGIRGAFPDLVVDFGAVGIFGRKVEPGQVLRAGERVEIYRPLIADPREARRRRAEQKKQG